MIEQRFMAVESILVSLSVLHNVTFDFSLYSFNTGSSDMTSPIVNEVSPGVLYYSNTLLRRYQQLFLKILFILV